MSCFLLVLPDAAAPFALSTEAGVAVGVATGAAGGGALTLGAGDGIGVETVGLALGLLLKDEDELLDDDGAEIDGVVLMVGVDGWDGAEIELELEALPNEDDVLLGCGAGLTLGVGDGVGAETAGSALWMLLKEEDGPFDDDGAEIGGVVLTMGVDGGDGGEIELTLDDMPDGDDAPLGGTDGAIGAGRAASVAVVESGKIESLPVALGLVAEGKALPADEGWETWGGEEVFVWAGIVEVSGEGSLPDDDGDGSAAEGVEGELPLEALIGSGARS